MCGLIHVFCVYLVCVICTTADFVPSTFTFSSLLINHVEFHTNMSHCEIIYISMQPQHKSPSLPSSLLGVRSRILTQGHTLSQWRIQDLKKGGRPGFWRLAPKFFLVNISQFMGLFRGGGVPLLDPPLDRTSSFFSSRWLSDYLTA